MADRAMGWFERLRRDVAVAMAVHAHQRAVLAHAGDMLDMFSADLDRIRRDSLRTSRELAALEAEVRRHRV